MIDERKVCVEDDPMGSELKAVLKKYGVGVFLISALDKEGQGATMFSFQSTQEAMTVLALLVRALPELFVMLDQVKLGAYLSAVDEALSLTKGDAEKLVAAKKAAENFDMNEFVKVAKF